MIFNSHLAWVFICYINFSIVLGWNFSQTRKKVNKGKSPVWNLRLFLELFWTGLELYFSPYTVKLAHNKLHLFVCNIRDIVITAKFYVVIKTYGTNFLTNLIRYNEFDCNTKNFYCLSLSLSLSLSLYFFLACIFEPNQMLFLVIIC